MDEHAAGVNALGAVTDVPGVRVGNVQRIGDGWLTGTTVVLPPPGSTAGVAVAGGAPATRETDALAPGTLVPGADAIVMTGGSAYGLDAAGGVMSYLEEHAVGFPAFGLSSRVVPVVPAAALFDLGRGGDYSRRPDAGFGYRAAKAAWNSAGQPGVDRPGALGTVGAGTGAACERGLLKGGLGTASVAVGDLIVGAIAAVNAAGDVAGPDGALYASAFTDRLTAPTAQESAAWRAYRESGDDATDGSAAPNTTIVTIATNAALDGAAVTRLAGAAHAGLARAIRPSHTLVDGDTVFAVATGNQPLTGSEPAESDPAAALVALSAMAQDAVMLAIADAVLTARVPAGILDPSGRRMTCYADLCPSVRVAP